MTTCTVSNKKSQRYACVGDIRGSTAHLVLQTHAILVGAINLFVAGAPEQLLDSLCVDSLGARGIGTLFMLTTNTST
jgi:hypothetical protein